MRRMSFAAAVLAGLTAAAAAQAKIPTFRASTHLVQINVVVDGKHGAVSGLSAKDFSIRDDGRPRAIGVFTENRTAAPGSARRTAEKATSYSNRGARARNMVVVLVDALNTANVTTFFHGQPTWRAAQAFQFARQGALNFPKTVPRDDRVALYGLSANGLRVLADFTDNRTRLETALRGYEPTGAGGLEPGGAAPTQAPGGFDSLITNGDALYARVARLRPTMLTMQALHIIGEHVAPLPGRVSLVWLTAVPPLYGALAEGALGTNNVAIYTVDARGLMTREAILAPLSHELTIERLELQPPGLYRLQDIARATGGRAFVNTNGIAQAIAAAANDSSESYTLGFYVSPAALQHRFHRLQVKVRGKGLHLRYPHGYWVPAMPGAAPLAAALRAAIADPISEAGLGLRAQLRPARAAGAVELDGKVEVNHLRFRTTDGRRVGGVRLMVLTQNATGRVLQSAGYRQPDHSAACGITRKRWGHFRRQRGAVGCQRSAISGQLSAISGQLSAISFRRAASARKLLASLEG